MSSICHTWFKYLLHMALSDDRILYAKSITWQLCDAWHRRKYKAPDAVDQIGRHLLI